MVQSLRTDLVDKTTDATLAVRDCTTIDIALGGLKPRSALGPTTHHCEAHRLHFGHLVCVLTAFVRSSDSCHIVKPFEALGEGLSSNGLPPRFVPDSKTINVSRGKRTRGRPNKRASFLRRGNADEADAVLSALVDATLQEETQRCTRSQDQQWLPIEPPDASFKTPCLGTESSPPSAAVPVLELKDNHLPMLYYQSSEDRSSLVKWQPARWSPLSSPRDSESSTPLYLLDMRKSQSAKFQWPDLEPLQNK